MPVGADPGAVVLEEEIDRDYEPTEKEIVEYADWLGIDAEKDPDLLWIAKAGLKAPLPHPWKPCQTDKEDGDIFYFNFQSGESVWDHPCDEYHRKLLRKELAKKYGTPFDESVSDSEGKSGAAGENSTSLKSSSVQDEDKKDKKSKKDKKDKKEKKDKRDKNAPKELAPLAMPAHQLGALNVGKLGLAKRERDMDLESSLEESLDPELESTDSLERRALERVNGPRPGEGDEVGEEIEDDCGSTSETGDDRDEGHTRAKLVAASSEVPNTLEEGKFLGPSLSVGGGLHSVAEEASDAAFSESGDVALNTSINSRQASNDGDESPTLNVRSRGKDRVDESKIALERQLGEVARNVEEEVAKKKATLDAENKVKLDKHRRDMQEELDLERDKIFAELQGKHDKQIREEKQRLKEEFTGKKASLKEEAHQEVATQDALQKRAQDSEAECEKLRSEVLDFQKRLQTAADTSSAASVERERLQGEFERTRQQTAQELEDLQGKLKNSESKNNQTAAEHETIMVKQKKDHDFLRERSEHLEAELTKAKAVGGELTKAKADAAGAGDETEMKALKSQLDAKTEELERLRGQLEDAKMEMEAKVAEYERLRTMNASSASSVDEIKRLQAKLLEEQQASDATGKEKVKAVEQVAELKGEVEVLSSEFAKAQSDLARVTTEKTSLEKEAADNYAMAARTRQAEEQLQAKVQEADSAQAELAELRRLKDGASSKDVDIKTSGELLEIRSERDRLRADKEKDAKRISSLDADLAKKAEECTGLQADVLRSQKAATSAEQELQTARMSMDRDRSELTRIKDDASHDAARTSGEHAKLKVELDGARSESRALKHKMEASAETSKSANDSVHSLQSECQRLRDAQEGMQRKFEEECTAAALARSDAAVASRELSMLKSELDTRTSDCERLHTKIAEGSSSRFDEVQHLQSQMVEERGLTAQARAESSATARELSMLKSELEMRTKECERLQVKAMESSRSAQDELQRVQGQLASQVRETSTARCELDAKDNDCKRLQERVADSSGSASEEVRRAQSLLEEERRASSHASEELRRSRSSLEHEREALAQLRVEVSTSERELHSTRAELEARANECSRLRSDCGATPEATQRLQAKVEEEGAAAAQAKAEAASIQRDLVALRAELDAKTSECGRLRGEVAGQAESASGQVRQAAEAAALNAELDSRSAECGRLRAELLRVENTAPCQGELRELASLRSQVADQRGELDSMRQHSSRGAPTSMTSEEERALRLLARDREDNVLQLKAEASQTAAMHSQELDSLRARLTETRGRQTDTQSAMVGDLQVQLRERAGEIERLHSEVRSWTSEAERLKYEARSSNLRSTTAEATAVEAAKASAADQWRRDVKRMEDDVRQRDGELAAAKEQIDRSQREMRRLEVDEHRSAQRSETTRTELEHARQEGQQLREDTVEAERRLEDARTTLRGEHAARTLSEGSVRESQREVRTLRDQLQQQAAEVELLSNEARRERHSVAENEAEIARLQQQMNAKEAELRQLRAAGEVQTQQGDASLRRRWAELGEREQAVGDRERLGSERERLCAEAEAALHERRRDLRADVQRLELAGLRSVAAEFSPGTRRGEAAGFLQLSPTPRRRGELGDGTAIPIEAPPFPMEEGLQASAPAASSDDGLEHVDARGLADMGEDGGAVFVADVASSPLGLNGARAADEAASALDMRRRDLRRQRVALDELRKQWKADLNRLQAGGTVQGQAVLDEIRAVLDERTAGLNRLIDEQRVLERALLRQRSGSAKQPVASAELQEGADGVAAKTFKVRPDTGGVITPRADAPLLSWGSPTEEMALMSRWQHLLSPSHQSATVRPKSARASYGASPRSASGDRHTGHWSRRTRASRDVVDQHLQFLKRSFQPDSLGVRPLSARASTRFQMGI